MKEIVKSIEMLFGKPIQDLSNYEWRRVSVQFVLNDGFVDKYYDKVHWDAILKAQIISDSLVNKYLYLMPKKVLLETKVLTESQLERIIDGLNNSERKTLARRQLFSFEFLLKHIDKIPLHYINKQCVGLFTNEERNQLERMKDLWSSFGIVSDD